MYLTLSEKKSIPALLLSEIVLLLSSLSFTDETATGRLVSDTYIIILLLSPPITVVTNETGRSTPSRDEDVVKSVALSLSSHLIAAVPLSVS